MPRTPARRCLKRPSRRFGGNWSSKASMLLITRTSTGAHSGAKGLADILLVGPRILRKNRVRKDTCVSTLGAPGAPGTRCSASQRFGITLA